MSTTNLADKKILLVEDNKTNQMVAKIILKKIGCQVDIAENGQEAVDKTAQTDYDIIFMDIHMPIMDGFQATQKIQERISILGKKMVPIVAMTAGASDDIAQCMVVGMQDNLRKPFKKEELEEMMLKWISN